MPSQHGHSADDHQQISNRDRDEVNETFHRIWDLLTLIRGEQQKFRKDFRDLLRILECRQQKPRVRFWLITEGQDELIAPKATRMKLATPLKPGFRRPITITPDEDVDMGANGTFFAIENVTGDSTTTVDPTSTAKSLKFWINGDGATGDKAIRVIADGHLGDGDQPVALDIEFTVAAKDATSLTLVEGVDEPISA